MSIKSIAKAKEKDFYDHVADGKQMQLFISLKPAYELLYKFVVNLIPNSSDVVDIGCGHGEFASLIVDSCKSYVGYDFSKIAIAEAKRLNPQHANKFNVVDLRKKDFPEADSNRIYVCLEVLEHLQDDLQFLAKLDIGSRFIVSVPSFDSESHMRYFKFEGDALNYYSSVLDIDYWRRIKLPHNKAEYFHLIRGSRK